MCDAHQSLRNIPLRLSCAFTHAATLHHLLLLKVGLLVCIYVNKDCAQQRAKQSVQRKKSDCFSSYVLQSHNCNRPFLRVLSVEFLIFSRLRSASPSAYGYQLCSTCISSVLDHLQIPHLPSGKTPGPGRTWTETAKHLLSRPRR